MTETQNIPSATCGTTTGHRAHRYFDNGNVSRPCSGEAHRIGHRAPLGRGEIRQYIVGGRHFVLMHSGNGSFTQAKVITAEGSRVLKTSIHEFEAVAAYADAIEQAEAEPAESIEPDATLFNLPMGADIALVTGEDDGPEEKTAAELLAIVRDNARRYVPGGGEQFLDRYLAQAAAELAELLDAYGAAMARGANALNGPVSPTPNVEAARPYADRADALKAEILARFGGEQ